MSSETITKNDLAEILSKIPIVMPGNLPGIIQMFAGSTAPAGWLICDGSAVSRTTYATLFAVIGTTYGTGDGSTTFNLPDMRGRVAVGVGNGTATEHTNHTLGQQGGRENAIIPYHNHGITDPKHKHTQTAHAHKLKMSEQAASGSARNNPISTASLSNSTFTDSLAPTIQDSATGITVNYAGTSGNVTGANMQPFLALNYIIYTGD